MMTTLTSTQISSIQTKITNNDIAGAYAELASYGDPYGTLAGSVTTNSTWEAKLSNAFAAEGGEKNSVDMSVGSTAWTSLNHALAVDYMQLYIDNSGVTPSWSQVQTIHNTEYGLAGLNADDWLPNRLLNDSGNPSATWSDLIANGSTADLWADSFDVAKAGAGLALNPWVLIASINDSDLMDKVRFADNFYNALGHMDKPTIEAMLADFTGNGAISALLSAVLNLPEGIEGLFNHIPSLPDILPHSLGSWLNPISTAYAAAESSGSPLILDLGTGGINVTSSTGSGSVYWDVDQDGFRERSGWIAGNSALLAIDKNSDGVINDNGELFGNTTTYANGFANLAQYDSNSDGHITSADTHFADLIVWTDDNHNGYSESSELHTLSSLSITDISLSYSSSSSTINGNAVKQVGTFTMSGVSHTIDDIWFAYDNTNTLYNGTYTLDPQTLFMPDQRGYGTLPSLHVAMSMDNAGTGNLLGLVSDLSSMSLSDVLSSSYDLQGALTDILYRWAGVDGVSPTSRGAYADAQELGFLEHLMGQDYLQLGTYTNPPGSAPIAYLHTAFLDALGSLGGNLLLQAGFGSLFGDPTYDLRSDAFSGSLIPDGVTLRFNQSGVDESITGTAQNDVYIFHAGDSPTASGNEILTESTSNGMDTVLFGGIDPDDVRIWDDAGGSLYIQYTSTDKLRIYDSSGSGVNTVSARVEHIAFDDGTVWDLTQGLPLVDTDDAHSLYGSAQNDTIDGRAGADTISGWGGNDTLIGGADADNLYGGTGDDTYVFSPGDGPGSGSYDYVYETSGEGTDTILFHDVLPADLRSWTDMSGNLYLQYSSTDLVRVVGSSFGANAIPNQIEHIAFDGGTNWDISAGLRLTDTDDAHSMFASNQNDVIDGRGGNDSIYGMGGDDTIQGGAGNDYLDGGDGTDTLSYALATSAVTVSLAVGSSQSTGGAGSDTIANFENLTGSAYNDTLTGNSGDNVIDGGAGTNSLTGGSGADIFAFDPAVTANNIQDFNTGQSDKLDISHLIEDYNPTTDAITDFVQITTSGSDSLLSIDQDGTGSTYGWTQVGTIVGVTGLTDEAALVTAGTLIV